MHWLIRSEISVNQKRQKSKMGISVENLTKYYGKQAAVQDLSFSVEEGEILGFLGPNGAGKTTSLKMIAGLLLPDEGAVYYGDLDIRKHPGEARRYIGYLPESNPLYLNLYVREALRFYADLHGVKNPKSRIEEIIEMTGLEQEAHKQIRMLSKGYRQRTGIGIAILHDPKIIILDEPISGLDPNQLADIRRLIRRLAADKTIIFSSHILSEVEQVCDRILIIHRGRRRALDTVQTLQGQLGGQQIIEAEFDRKIDPERLRRIGGLASYEALSGRRVKIMADPGEDIRAALYQWTIDEKVILLESRSAQASMERIFEKLTE